MIVDKISKAKNGREKLNWDDTKNWRLVHNGEPSECRIIWLWEILRINEKLLHIWKLSTKINENKEASIKAKASMANNKHRSANIRQIKL